MSLPLQAFGLRLPVAGLATSSRSYRPPSWPPPDDWVVSEDKVGNALSRFGDDVWDFSPWAGKVAKVDLSGGNFKRGNKSQKIHGRNLEILRLLLAWFLWGPNANRGFSTFRNNAVIVRKLIGFCGTHNIDADRLTRYPALLDEFISKIPASSFSKTIYIFHVLWEWRDELGIQIFNPRSLARIAEFTPTHEIVQTAYMPPRIWSYQINRLRECLDDYNRHRTAVEECYHFCVDAYCHNFGSLEKALDRKGKKDQSKLPFQDRNAKHALKGIAAGAVMYGVFTETLKRYGIEGLLRRWVPYPEGGWTIKQLSSYFSLVQQAGQAYLISFTLQRVTESLSLRVDCLVWENDPKLGRIPIICGETTKTDPDSDARWPTSPSVEHAMIALVSIAHMRMRCAVADPYAHPSTEDQKNPRLFDRSYEPWGGRQDYDINYDLRKSNNRYKNVLRRFQLLFDVEQLRITEEDLRIALFLTPNLGLKSEFSVGEIWPLAWHQLRRTSAVNMFASGLLSDTSMQFLMKHSSRLMPLYYARGYSRLPVNGDAGALVVETMYENMSHVLLQLTSERYVSPYGPDRKRDIVVNLIGQRSAKDLASAGSRGETSFREILLGGCTKVGHCPYGGIESVARCGGGDGKDPCFDALFDREKQKQTRVELKRVKEQMKQMDKDSPIFRALKAERIAMENYLNDIE